MHSNAEEDISEEIPIELLQRGVKISDKEVLEHDFLILEEIEGNLLNGKILEINAKGLKTGLRGEQDGMCYFGTGEKNSEGRYLNDFILNIDTSYSPVLKDPHVFLIYYRSDLQKYYIDNVDENNQKYFIFVLLNQHYPIPIGEKILVSVLDYNFKLSVNKETNDLVIEYGQGNTLETIIFKKVKTKLMMGRKPDCDLVINDPRFSREQSMFYFDTNKSTWFIKDGGNEKPSGSGTWLFVDRPFNIKSETTIKLGPSLMKIQVKKF